MRAINFKMLKLARESRGITQTELANLIPGLGQGNLSKMEKGILSVADEITVKIAETLNYPVTFFCQQEPKSPVHSFYYRKRQVFPKKELLMLEAKMDVIRLALDELLSSVDIPSYKLPEIQPDGLKSPEDIARHVRTILKIPRGPIDKLNETLERAGVLVYFMDFDSEKFDGITLFTNSGYPVIFVNSRMPNDRKRFTIGHELGHLVMHIPFDEMSEPEVVEGDANRFSSEFNMPEIDCRMDLIGLKFGELDNLKAYWKMSKAAILYRAKALRLITEKTYKYMVIELARRGERKVERGVVSLDEPKLIDAIVSFHKKELGYSIPELSEMLRISKEDYMKNLDFRRGNLRIA